MAVLDKHNSKGQGGWNKNDIKDEIAPILDELYEYSKRLYAEGEQSILLVLQGMDASGKDGLTRTLFAKSSPAWVNVHSFKKPTEEELSHDFLWRIHRCAPKKGMITVFNRSHYEDILVPSVYRFLDQPTIDNRYDQINQFEKHLQSNGTKVIKCYLNVSYKKQEEKLLERINTKEKHWKHSDGDWATREHWEEFMKVYELLFERCNEVTWHIIPSDTNWAKLYTTAKIVLAALKEMNPQFGALDTEKFTPDYSER
ncbi:MAG: PPK2 family polyphosphate:nucleotide phosphotransferase [Patiriisocius sp.]|jgi:PPK2 family polyphosphate:nucleotide phosphotransferase